ncbi:DUF6985 domain-containing protein, partial [Actinomadura monticuli]
QPATGPPGSYPDRTHTGKRRRAYEQDQPLTRHHLPFCWAHGKTSLECECDWEQEHGLQMVFRDVRTVTKIGPCDGHLTNSAAWGDDSLDGIVYHSSR